MDPADADRAKQAVRERIWALLDRSGVVLPPGAHGKIPNFIGSDDAAARLGSLPAWRDAAVIKANPDKAQLPVRALALAELKLVYMAVPKLADIRPFFLLDPTTLGPLTGEAASSRVAATVAPKVSVEVMRPIDLIVCGSVAVSPGGVRLGKGAGYSDIEVALLSEAGLIKPETVIVTTVHDLQVVDGDLPETEHDFSVDIIVTPTEVIACGPPRRPKGVLWAHLDSAKIKAIPALEARASAR